VITGVLRLSAYEWVLASRSLSITIRFVSRTS